MVQLCVNLFYEKLINIFLRFKNLNYFELHSGELFAQLRKYKKNHLTMLKKYCEKIYSMYRMWCAIFFKILWYSILCTFLPLSYESYLHPFRVISEDLWNSQLISSVWSCHSFGVVAWCFNDSIQVCHDMCLNSNLLHARRSS